ncbi:hypothetical protein NDU88_004698 [Pleurodeles waltl]|uniref:Uncharacterized protein n=1 Tax=Pleurodeles waltl TaxID=8319 RepID=A0AAV7TRZ4_PLEWA|nr:hypothetical protein NDU88_004698 [Pleurodeles waltl]
MPSDVRRRRDAQQASGGGWQREKPEPRFLQGWLMAHGDAPARGSAVEARELGGRLWTRLQRSSDGGTAGVPGGDRALRRADYDRTAAVKRGKWSKDIDRCFDLQRTVSRESRGRRSPTSRSSAEGRGALWREHQTLPPILKFLHGWPTRVKGETVCDYCHACPVLGSDSGLVLLCYARSGWLGHIMDALAAL